MKKFDYYDKNRTIVEKIVDNIKEIQSILDESLGSKDLDKYDNYLITMTTLLGGVYTRVNDQIVEIYCTSIEPTSNNELGVTLQGVMTFYLKDQYVLPLVTQLNKNLKNLVKYYRFLYGEDYEINTKKLNKLLQETINENLKLDLRGIK